MNDFPAVTTAADATAIADAFREFVKVHQALLNILIGKSGLVTTVPFVGPPVAAVLRQIEAVVDVSIGFPSPFRSLHSPSPGTMANLHRVP
jgi:hypothetical protein